MPIASIITQPSASSLRAAYRPIVLVANATRTDGDPIPPVVYCDIYVNSIFYKTIAKTQYYTNNGGNTSWRFDISDAIQEVLKSELSDNGGDSINNDANSIASIFCKFRSSGIDVNGFIQYEGTAPIQATGSSGATGGTGTQSNTFFVLNSTLQQVQNQELATHLNAFKSGTWNSATYPLTHRTDNYRVCKHTSDFFPIVTNGTPDCVRLNYKLKGQTEYTQVSSCGGSTTCTNVGIIASALPDAEVGVPYSASITLTGTSPYVISNKIKPSWMTISNPSPSGVVSFTGTPTAPATNVTVSFDVNNCSGVGHQFYSDHIDVTQTCVAVSFNPDSLPDAVALQPYDKNLTLSGTPPFVLGAYDVPTWMTVNLVDDTVMLGGTPAESDETTGLVISIPVTNDCGSDTFEDTIDVGGPTTHPLSIRMLSGVSYWNNRTEVCTAFAGGCGTSLGVTIYVKDADWANYLAGTTPVTAYSDAAGTTIFVDNSIPHFSTKERMLFVTGDTCYPNVYQTDGSGFVSIKREPIC